MCSIFGMGFQKGHCITGSYYVKKAIKDLFERGEMHGRDASGLAITSEDKISVLKDDIHGSDFIKTPEFSNFFDDSIRLLETKTSTVRPTLSILGHCRAATKGTYTDNNNNHPIITSNTIGIHNGCINNDDAIFAGNPKMPRRGRVDSEVIFRLIDNYYYPEDKSNKTQMANAIMETCKRISGWYACACVNKTNPHLLWIFRDNTQLTVKHYKKTGVIVFATTESMINNSIDESMFGKPTEVELPRNHILGINLLTNQKVLTKIESA